MNVNRNRVTDNTCTFELRLQGNGTSRGHHNIMQCDIMIRSALSRIVPHCNDTRDQGNN